MLRRHVSGDPHAFRELVDHYGTAVYGYLHRAGVKPTAVDDLFQETFLRVHAAAGRYDERSPFRLWLYTIAHNLIRDHLRRQRVRRIMTSFWRRPAGKDEHAPDEPLDPRDDRPAVDQQVVARQQVDWLQTELLTLAEGPRQALLLTQVEGMSLQEAAKVLGVPVGTVKTWVRRSRLALADALARREQGGAP